MRKFIKIFIPNILIQYRKVYQAMRIQHKQLSLLDYITKCSPILVNRKINRTEDYIRQMKLSFRKIRINTNDYYIYPYDPFIYRQVLSEYKLICSITVDFSKVLSTDINILKNRLRQCTDVEFGKRHIELLNSIEKLAAKISNKLRNYKDKRTATLSSYFPELLYRTPESLDEAIQKLLFFNALFWQANHWHIGIGRLDHILYKYYIDDIKTGKLSKQDATLMLKRMCQILGKDTMYKSKTSLIGDTGQYILLGGIDEKGNNIDNELTHILLDIFKEFNQPDPKLILRVNSNTDISIWKNAVNCVLNGNGSPLFMNEVPIIKNMSAFGYDTKDLFSLGTSACWEPLIIGKSFDQNNTLPCIISLLPLNQIIINNNEEYSDFKSFLDGYKTELANYISTCIHDIQYDCSPLFTLFFDDCIEKQKDFTQGGARYAFHGIQVVSFPNTINSLLNIKELVYERQIISLRECGEIIKSNFDGIHQDKLSLINTCKYKFGSTNEHVIGLTNDLMEYIGEVVGKHSMNGKPIKVGFSSPNYIMSCRDIDASMDGRKKGEPFAVHISPISSDIDISEILDFAASLNYNKNRINGNIVDFIVPESYKNNIEKLVYLIKNACNNGLFELQLNVFDYNKLLDAKKNPNKYPSLIVRVWGFSAYFNDLPDEYKDLLIERARLYEAS